MLDSDSQCGYRLSARAALLLAKKGNPLEGAGEDDPLFEGFTTTTPGSESPPLEPEATPAANAAMEALRNLKKVAKGGTPASDQDSTGMRGRHVRSMVTACLCSCAAGTTLGFASAAMPSIESESWYRMKQAPQNRWFTDILAFGAAIGALLSGCPLRVFGSRMTLLLCVLVMALSWGVLAASSNTTMLLSARAGCGLWLGVIDIGVSLYVAEVAPMDSRAFYTGLTELLQSASCAQLFFLRGIQAMEGLVKDVPAELAALIMMAMHVSFVVLFTSLTRSTGRRQLLCVSTLLEVFCFVVFPPFEHLAFSEWSTAGPPDETNWSFVYSVNLLVLSYSVGLCHLPSLFIAELCSGPGWLRYLGAPAIWATRWFIVFALVEFNEQFLTVMRLRNAHMYAALAMSAAAGTLLFLLPETEGRSLADIELQ
ncbi:hypothetical protein HPB51_015145 [Rhipicephalus microplus]|uniref:Sugar transporter n=1 Tax=Rhipicephalus microplus TaxID=6941 RepID=A0A9J6DNR8_RHIMP|nr:hypothetical protein HPB51_015145 [Rhipicephalus microplus]